MIDVRRNQAERHVSAARPVAVDPLEITDTFDLRDRVEGSSLESDPAIALRGIALHEACDARQRSSAPASIAPRGTEAGDLRFDNGHPQPRVMALQVVGRPESRVARTHDGDVHMLVSAERGPRHQRIGDVLVPERLRSVLSGIHERFQARERRPGKSR